MRKLSLVASCILLAGILSMSSCVPGSNNTTPQAPSSSAPTPSTPTDADGAFAAVKSISTTEISVAGFPSTTITTILGTAVAWLGAPNNFVDAGDITCTTEPDSVYMLSKQSNNSYVYDVSASNASGGGTIGIHFDGTNNVIWDVTGNSGNGISAFTRIHSNTFPSISGITQSGDVETNQDFTLSATTSVTGDSVIFIVAGPSGNVMKVKGPNTNSCTFTAAEMGTVGTGDNVGLLQIAPYKMTSDTYSGKKYYFIKEACVSKFVNLK